jgi:hypothetical protein
MLRKLLLSGVAVIGLMAGTQSASAQQVVYACKNNTTGVLILFANSTTCQPGWTLTTLNVTGPPGPPGPAGPTGATGAMGPAGINGTALAARQFVCSTQSLSQEGQFVQFSNPVAPSSFGTSINATGSLFSSILLSSVGAYQIDLSIDVLTILTGFFPAPPGIQLLVNGSPLQFYNYPQSSFSVPTWSSFNSGGVFYLRGGIMLIIQSPNSTLNFSFINNRVDFTPHPQLGLSSTVPNGGNEAGDCKVLITQIH